jgi:alpha-mannosidase
MHVGHHTLKSLALAAALSAAYALAPVEAATVWQIGQADNSTAEFGFAPGNYKEYRTPGFFVVGVSDPKTDWPYVQPGVIDGGWAPGSPQTFEIVFGLQAVPADGAATLVLDLADTHSIDPPKLKVDINGHASEHPTPKGAGDASVLGNPTAGREHVIAVEVPAEWLKAGENRISITTLTGSWVLWDAVRFEASADLKLAPIEPRTAIRSIRTEPALFWHGGEEAHPVVLTVTRIGPPAKAEVRVDGQPTGIELRSGTQDVTAYRSPVTEAVTAKVELVADGRSLAEGTVDLAPVRHWEFHIVHQTHLDIGFTHTQEEVLKRQVEHLKTAMRYIDETAGYPPPAQFKWHPEGMWAVDEFMATEPDAAKDKFLADCRARSIHLDSLYAQAMTGMYSEEELMELMSAAKRFERAHGVPVVSAMQSDVPGYTWGLTAALAHNGVDFLSAGPNYFWNQGAHRGGRVMEWADRPFWWVSPSGKEKVLFWMTGWGYSGFHSGRQDVPDSLVFDYIRHLEEKGYPYDMVMWRYSIGGDNGPPSKGLADRIKQWNEKYAWPRLVMARNSDVMKEFAERYGDKIPNQRGDFTPFWEDGSASTAKATGANRRAAERLAQVQILWSMLHPDLALHDRVDTAWNKMVMYDEHTWGAHCSISRPDDPFSVRQDEYKQAYAFDGARLTEELLRDIAAPVAGAAIDVYNTASWPRGGLVLLSKEQSAAGDLVKDDGGKAVPSQRLASGELAVMAGEIPAFGARRYTLHPGTAAPSQGGAKAEGLALANGLLSLEIDPQSGAIKSLRVKGVEGEWVDVSKAEGLNSYLYIIGRNADQGRARVAGPATVVVEDPGPLVATLRVESDAPGCVGPVGLVRRVRLLDGADHVELINTTDKLKERRPEGLYFGFPFNLPGATARVDVPWAVVEVEKDQLPGANRNFYCVQRFVDLSAADRGVTWVTVDAPMLQFDPIKIAQPFGVQYWREHIDPSACLWSWTMNNHWECNYKADQDGLITFRYALRPHAGGYDAVAAQRFGRDVCQPLIAVAADGATPVAAPLLGVEGQGSSVKGGVVVTQVRPSRDGKATMVRLFNVADEPRKVSLAWNRPVGATWISNPMEDETKKAPAQIELAKFEIVTLRTENRP